MRAAFVSLLLVAAAVATICAATVAGADVSLDARPASHPHTPLGPRCDGALAAAQAQFQRDTPAVDFHVREHRVVGEYSWSDMCGVWGSYRVELAPDLRPPHAWQWATRPRTNEDESFHRRGTRRAGGWRARFVIDGDSDGSPGDSFVAAFRPAVEVCLDEARRSDGR